MVQAWRQDSLWLEPWTMSMLQHSCSAAHMAWHSPKALTAAALASALALAAAGVLGGDLRGDVVGTLEEFLGKFLVKILVDILVKIIEVLLFVRLPGLILERDTGVGVVGVGVGVRREGGGGFAFTNLRVGLDLMDGVVADVLFELLRELLGDIDGLDIGLRWRGCGLERVFVGFDVGAR